MGSKEVEKLEWERDRLEKELSKGRAQYESDLLRMKVLLDEKDSELRKVKVELDQVKMAKRILDEDRTLILDEIIQERCKVEALIHRNQELEKEIKRARFELERYDIPLDLHVL